MWAVQWWRRLVGSSGTGVEETWREDLDTISFDEESTFEENWHLPSPSPSPIPYSNRSGIIKDPKISAQMKNCREILSDLESTIIKELEAINDQVFSVEEIPVDYGLYPDPVDTWKKLKYRKHPPKPVLNRSTHLLKIDKRSTDFEDRKLIQNSFAITEQDVSDWKKAESNHMELDGWFSKETEYDRTFLDTARKISLKKIILDTGYVPVFSRKSSRETEPVDNQEGPGPSQPYVSTSYPSNSFQVMVEEDPRPAFSFNQPPQATSKVNITSSMFSKYKESESDEEEFKFEDSDKAEKLLKTPPNLQSEVNLSRIEELFQLEDSNPKESSWGGHHESNPISFDTEPKEKEDQEIEETEQAQNPYYNSNGADGIWDSF